VVEKAELPGGLASSFVDKQGFTWDIGGHVQFSHYRYYDEVLDHALGDAWLHHERESWIWIRNRFVPYPFQNNLHRLGPKECREALKGLVRASKRGRAGQGSNFREWIENTFGTSLSELFMLPYNFKVWGYPLEQLGTNWIGERVSVPDVDRIRANVAQRSDDVSWGPNRTFRFPLKGGTGAIWQGVASLIEPSHFRFSSEVDHVDAEGRVLNLTGGHKVLYDHLINTMPLDVFCGRTSGISRSVIKAASKLVHSSSHILGVGLKGEMPERLNRKCWMYFPEDHSPYYRVTVFSHYSPFNVPEPGYWSLMAEVCETPFRKVDTSEIQDWTYSSMLKDELIDDRSQIVSHWWHKESHGYPTPFLGREEVLEVVLGGLERLGIYSRGRFGAWRYEVSNQDHSFMQGVELVNRMLGIGDEHTLRNADYVNSGVFLKKNPWQE
jgi:protoporphyrinogen oxidase